MYTVYIPECIYMRKVTTPQDAYEQFSAAGFPWLKHFPGYEQIKQNKNKRQHCFRI